MFDIGQRVVCIDGRFAPPIAALFAALPAVGRIYTVRDVVPGIEHDLSHTCAIYLEEIHSDPNPHGIEPGFAPWRFAEFFGDMNSQEETANHIKNHG